PVTGVLRMRTGVRLVPLSRVLHAHASPRIRVGTPAAGLGGTTVTAVTSPTAATGWLPTTTTSSAGMATTCAGATASAGTATTATASGRGAGLGWLGRGGRRVGLWLEADRRRPVRVRVPRHAEEVVLGRMT